MTLRNAVHRAAHFHLAETQPDHATNQPWALFAFLWHPDTVPLADAMLHTATAHASGTLPGLTTPIPGTLVVDPTGTTATFTATASFLRVATGLAPVLPNDTYTLRLYSVSSRGNFPPPCEVRVYINRP